MPWEAGLFQGSSQQPSVAPFLQFHVTEASSFWVPLFKSPNYWEREFDWFDLTEPSSSESMNSSQGDNGSRDKTALRRPVWVRGMVPKDNAGQTAFQWFVTVRGASTQMLGLCTVTEADP